MDFSCTCQYICTYIAPQHKPGPASNGKTQPDRADGGPFASQMRTPRAQRGIRIFSFCIRTTMKRRVQFGQPAEEMSERYDHGKNFGGKSESSFSPSHSFCRCTTFWRGTPRQHMKLDCYNPGPLDFAGLRPPTRCVLCVKLLNRSHGGPRTT
jgi:hypothetical protein